MSTTFFTDLSTVTLLSTMSLDGKALTKIFSNLIENDTYIADNFSNVIGIWQCNWYYDKNVSGYPMGHLCWLNTEEPVEFVKKHHAAIQEYTDLNSKIINKLPDFDEFSDEVLQIYYNAMTGYTDPTIGIVSALEPIFDIGDYTKGAQLVVSLKDNNKSLVTDETSWKPMIVDSRVGTDKIKSLVAVFLKDVLSTHMLQYHLSGNENDVEKTLSTYMDEFQEKQSIDKLEDKFYMSYRSNRSHVYGVDYVVNYVRKPYSSNGVVSEYQAFREWKSGLLEHFGTISKENALFRLSNYLTIPFEWKYVGVGSTKAYVYGGISEKNLGMLSVLETDDSQVSPLDNFINATYVADDYSIDGSDHSPSFSNNGYSIVVSPIYQNLSGIADPYLNAMFSAGSVNTKWNPNYLISSIDLSTKTRRQCAINLSDIRIVPPYISYYAIGKKG